MNNEDIINYITQTPENTNPNIIRGMLNKEGPGTSPIMIVHFELSDFDTDPYGTYYARSVTSDKTIDEIAEAVKNSIIVIGIGIMNQSPQPITTEIFIYTEYDSTTGMGGIFRTYTKMPTDEELRSISQYVIKWFDYGNRWDNGRLFRELDKN